MTAAAVNGTVTRAIRDALGRVAAENRELLRLMSQTDREPPTFRHCTYCGHPVCGCGLNGYDESGG